MSPYFETIKIVDGKLQNISFHQMRFERTRSLELGLRQHPDLDRVIQLPGGLEHGMLKCRVSYGKSIDLIEFEPYVRRVFGSLKLVESNSVTYAFKYSSRAALDELFRLRGSCDDILIVKNGCITDSSIANVVFLKGETWYTPDTPLLHGTMRASLLAEGKVTPRRITPDDLDEFQVVGLINAMNGWNQFQGLPVGAVSY